MGEWSFDYATQVFRSSPGISQCFGIDAGTGERGVPVEVYERAIHPDDVKWLRSTRAAPPGWSGLRVTEIRVIDTAGRERWLMVRGRFVLDENDRPLFGYGVMLDMTTYHQSGDRAFVNPAAPLSEPLVELLNALADAYRAARQIGLTAIERSCRALLFRSTRHLAHERVDLLQRGQIEGTRKRLH